MRPKHILLCCLLAAACAQTFGKPRDYAYWMEEPKWTEERAKAKTQLKSAWMDLTHRTCVYIFPDSILSDAISYGARTVNGGEMHTVEYTQNGMPDYDCYYKDAKGMSLPVLQGVYANNGQPYSLYDYFYIGSDGLIQFNLRKNIEMILWCLNVLVSPWLWLVVVLLGLYKILAKFSKIGRKISGILA